jgi:hypothetical protein
MENGGELAGGTAWARGHESVRERACDGESSFVGRRVQNPKILVYVQLSMRNTNTSCSASASHHFDF